MDTIQQEQRQLRTTQSDMNLRRSRLSEYNLRAHTAACSKKPYSPMDTIRAVQPYWEMTITKDVPRPDSRLGSSRQWLSPHDIDQKARRKASLETLSLYSGNVASLSTPMDRLIARQSASPHRGQRLPKIPSGPGGDWELVDAHELASELSGGSQQDDDAMSVGSQGSLRASSDTLSVSRERFLEESEGQKEQASRSWRRRTRRRNTVEKSRGASR